MAGPTLTRSPRPPAIVRTNHDGLASHVGADDGAGARGRSSGLRRKIHTQWMVLGAALTVLAGLLVAWGLTQAADRVAVVSVARPVAAGTVLQAADLSTTGIAFDGAAPGLVPAASLDELIGRAATIDLQAGSLLTAGMWTDGSALAPTERTVGVVLEAGRHPVGLAQGMSAVAVALDDDLAGITVRILDTTPTQVGGASGAVSVTLAVDEADATRIARLGATGRLVLVGLPAGSTTPAAATPPADAGIDP